MNVLQATMIAIVKPLAQTSMAVMSVLARRLLLEVGKTVKVSTFYILTNSLSDRKRACKALNGRKHTAARHLVKLKHEKDMKRNYFLLVHHFLLQ